MSRLFRFACDEDVSKMAARERGHHCQSCNKTVVDMSQLTPDEAVHTLRAAGKGTCVSYAFASDGRLVFRAARRAGGTALLTMAAFLAACQSPAVDGETRFDPPAELAKNDAQPVAVTEPVPGSEERALAGEPVPSPPASAQPAPTTSWPSATSSTVVAGSPPAPALPAKPHSKVRPASPPKPPPTPKLAGKPAIHYAAGGPMIPDDELL